MGVRAIKGNITELKVDAIVNAANSSLMGGGGVDGCIHRVAGPKLLEACSKLGGCDVGGAKITNGFNLPAKYVIHAVGPVYHGSARDGILLASCYRNSLDLARRSSCHSIAFPCISTGAYGYPREEAAKIACAAVDEWIGTYPEYDIDVIFCCYGDGDLEVYKRLLEK